MEEMKPKPRIDIKEQEIVFSKSIKAGKRIYYIDVKRNRKDDLFVAITESKKIISGFDEDAQISYEKHKIFLYKEDFDKFIDNLQEVVTYIKTQGESQGIVTPKDESKDENELGLTLSAPMEFNMEEFEK